MAGRLCAAAVLCGLAGLAAAQPADRRVDPLDITGANLAGLRLPVGVSEGAIELRADRVWRWTVPGPARADGSTAQMTQRLLLSGDALIRIGTSTFGAAKAAVWLEPLASGDPDAGPDVWQVYMLLDRAGNPTEDAAVAVSADRLPLQGVIRVTGGVKLLTSVSVEGVPDDPFVREAERTLAIKLRSQVIGKGPAPTSPDEQARRGIPIPALQPGLSRPYEPLPMEDPRKVADIEGRLPPAERDEPIFAQGGIISHQEGDAKYIADEKENAVVLSDHVTIQYWDRRRDQTLELTAERGVIFLAPGTGSGQSRFDKDSVLGIYLEGDVIATIVTSKGKYSIRSPKVYYSPAEERALLVDAVFWTYDEKRQLPLYVRAKTISQESANQFKATSATLTNTAFFEPDFSVGASTLTLTKQRSEDGDQRTIVDARNITLNAGSIPFFYWPILRGDPEAIPLKDVRIENSSGSGAALKTTWNLYSLLGMKPRAQGNDADLLLDYFGERGPAFGTNLDWKGENYKGNVLAYTLPADNGKDLLVTGERKTFEDEWRGMILAEHRATLSDEWTLFAEGSYISDETFVTGFFEPLARERREFANSLYVRRLNENSSLSAEARGTFNDFLANEYLLQTPGYMVQKLPEVGYARIADDLVEGHDGLLTYTSEYRISRMNLVFNKPNARDFGFANGTRSRDAFGILPGQSIADRLRLAGYSEAPVDRFDTRHEVSAQLAAGPVSIQPFIVGRFTGYDDDFASYSAAADEPYRAWGAEGITLSTEIQRVDNSVESRLLDLHRLRHIVQPSVTVWHADSTIDRVNLPVYDDDVESIAEGTATKFGLVQILQTQRGGPGRWRSVDVLKVDTELVVSSGDVDKESPVGRFIDYRPELSNLGGTFATVDAAWQLSEVFAIGVSEVYDFDINQPAKTSIGGVIRHDEFATYVDMRNINSQNQTYVVLGAEYQLTPKYTLGVEGAYDTELGEFQGISGLLRRKFPSVAVGVGIGYNNITGESSLSFTVQPVGVQRPGARLQGIGGRQGADTGVGS